MNQWFAEWFEIHKKPYIKESSVPVTQRKYRNPFGKLLGNRKIKDILNIDVQFAINELKEEGKGASTIKNALGFLTQCMEMAKQNGLISKNPCFEIKVDWKPKKILFQTVIGSSRGLSVDELSPIFFDCLCRISIR